MYEDSQRSSDEEGDKMWDYPSPDNMSLTRSHDVRTISEMGENCEGHGTISDQRRFGPPMGRGQNQSEIAHHPDDIPTNHSGRPEAQFSLNRGKPRQRFAQKGVPLKYDAERCTTTGNGEGKSRRAGEEDVEAFQSNRHTQRVLGP